MLLISNNCEDIGVPYPKEAVIRINTAWVNTIESLKKELTKLTEYDIYLDYPIGRKKPPLPQMSWGELLNIVEQFHNIKYFAWSNAENTDSLEFARMKLPERVMLVPKIETLIGVLHIEKIVEASKTKLIMIDKEDLFSAAKNNELYNHFLEYARNKAKELKIECIELKGVLFANS